MKLLIPRSHLKDAVAGLCKVVNQRASIPILTCVRLDAEGKPRILEVNAIPLLYPDVTQASFVCAAEVAGYSYPALINRVLQLAAARYGLASN